MNVLKSLCFLFVLSSCNSRLSTHAMNYGSSTIEAIHVAVIDMKQAYDKQQLDLELLEEKYLQLEKRGGAQIHELLVALEKKVANLEKTLEKTRSELNQFTNHATQTTHSLMQYRDKIEGLERTSKQQEQRIDEVVKIKYTLNSISKAMGASTQAASKIHKVRSGDSLEKIARKYDTSIDAIKGLNSLNSNTIFIDQELRIPD